MKTWSYEELLGAIRSSISIAQVLEKLGLKPQGSNYKTIHRYVAKYNLDTSHLLGKAHLKGQKRINIRRPLKEILVKDDTIHVKTEHLKKRLVDENILEYKCTICNVSSWLEKDLSLHLDHIDGDSYNNKLENLRFLCPNCHSQTETYCGKKNKLPRKRCKDCNKELELLSSKRCRECEDKSRLNNNLQIQWPPINELIHLTQEVGYSEIGRRLNVSANAVKKHIKKRAN